MARYPNPRVPRATAAPRARRAPVPQPYYEPALPINEDYTQGLSPSPTGPYTEPQQDAQDTASYLQDSGYPLGDLSPYMQQSRNVNIGPVSLSGSGVDNASLAILQQMQGFQPRNVGEGLFAGLAQGLAGSRARGMLAREQQNQQVSNLADERRKAASSFASELAKHRWQMQAEAAQAAMKSQVPVPGSPEALKILQDESAARARGTNSVPVRATPVDPSVLSQTIQDVVNFNTDPTRVPRDKNFRALEAGANAAWRAAGSSMTMQRATMLKKEADQFYKTMDNQRFTTFRQSAMVVKQHLDQFRDFYARYENVKPASPLAPVSLGVYQLAKGGWLGQDAQDEASGLQPIVEALPKEIATAVAGGRVPYEQEVRSAQNNYVTPTLRPSASSKQLDSTTKLIGARVRSQLAGTPYAGGGKSSNPYLLDPSPLEGWDTQGNPTPGPQNASQARNPVAESALIRNMDTALRQPDRAGRSRAVRAVSAAAAAVGIPPERIQAVVDSLGASLQAGR